MAPFMSSVEVDPVPREPARHNLVSSSYDISGDRGDADRWQGGLTWRPDACAQAGLWDPSCGLVGDQVKDLSVTNPEPGAMRPFMVYTTYECHVVSGDISTEEKPIVENRLNSGLPKAVEAEFWGATLDLDNWSLTSETPNASGNGNDNVGGILNPLATTNPTPVSPEVALLMLAQALANCGSGSKGMIHVPPYLGELWALKSYLIEEPHPDAPDDATRNRLVTRGRGDVIVVGSGYTGLGPVGNPKATPDDGTAWAYATGMVATRIGDINYAGAAPGEVVNRATNELLYIVERPVAFQTDGCCVFGVLVDVS